MKIAPMAVQSSVGLCAGLPSDGSRLFAGSGNSSSVPGWIISRLHENARLPPHRRLTGPARPAVVLVPQGQPGGTNETCFAFTARRARRLLQHRPNPTLRRTKQALKTGCRSIHLDVLAHTNGEFLNVALENLIRFPLGDDHATGDERRTGQRSVAVSTGSTGLPSREPGSQDRLSAADLRATWMNHFALVVNLHAVYFQTLATQEPPLRV